jgi:hypothetical protein
MPYEKKPAVGGYPEQHGKGVMYWNEVSDRKHEMSPDYSGYVLLEMDYKRGEKLYLGAWKKDTSRGNTLLSIKEDNWLKKKRLQEQGVKMQDREVTPGYAKVHKPRDEDDSIPF